MEPAKRTSLAGGCLIALCVLVGVVWGAYARQPSIGFLAGLGAGLVFAMLIWLADRLRR